MDLCKPIDKKLYKGTSPSCHDFNETTAVCDCAPLLVGFTTGQIQLVQPGKREAGRLYNEEVSYAYAVIYCTLSLFVLYFSLSDLLMMMYHYFISTPPPETHR